ncbi:MAG: hypothetical protein D6814_07070 [Calditrichaeota bacterium]|nr:MAG: hypothetical protein D6814_07070 [Calditrichota bacterium]
MSKRPWTLLVLFMFGCAGTQNVSMKYRVRDIPASYERTFEATVSYLEERGFALQTVDKKTGRIETAYRPGSGWGKGFTGDKRSRVIARVESLGENQSRLTLDCISETRTLSSGWQLVTMDVGDEQIVYHRFFKGIVARALGKSIN